MSIKSRLSRLEGATASPATAAEVERVREFDTLLDRINEYHSFCRQLSTEERQAEHERQLEMVAEWFAPGGLMDP